MTTTAIETSARPSAWTRPRMTAWGWLRYASTLACLVPVAMFMGAVGTPAVLYSFMPPPAMDIHTLTDGRRTVTYVSMMHVASSGFYDRVRDRIRAEGAKGASYLWEGVGFRAGAGKPGIAMSDFDRMLERRSMTADAAGLVDQPQETFLGLTGRPDVWADMDASELPERYKAMDGGQDGAYGLVGVASDAYLWCEAYVASFARRFPNGPIAYIYGRQERYTLASVITPADGMPDRAPWSTPREARLKEVVEATPGDVVITYGGAHYPGFRALLGPAWREVSVERNPLFE